MMNEEAMSSLHSYSPHKLAQQADTIYSGIDHKLCNALVPKGFYNRSTLANRFIVTFNINKMISLN